MKGRLGAVHRSEEGVYVDNEQHHRISSRGPFFRISFELFCSFACLRANSGQTVDWSLTSLSFRFPSSDLLAA
jgi:hypothetical protein